MRRRKVYQTIWIVIGAGCLGMAAVFVMSLTASRPLNLGVRNGKLADAPASPNCVSTQATDAEHAIAPLVYQGDGSGVMKQLESIVKEMPGSTIIDLRDDYLYAEFRSAIFRFVDDVELFHDPKSQCIHFRSASRTGYSDLGVNRKRMESIRLAFSRHWSSAATDH